MTPEVRAMLFSFLVFPVLQSPSRIKVIAEKDTDPACVPDKEVRRIYTYVKRIAQIGNAVHSCKDLLMSREICKISWKDQRGLLSGENAERRSELSWSPQWESLHLLLLPHSLSSLGLAALLLLFWMHLCIYALGELYIYMLHPPPNCAS